MGMWMSNILQLSDRDLIPPNCRILDIGSQNLYFASVDDIRRFVSRHGSIGDQEAFTKEAERIAYFSTPRPGERTAYISEVFDLVPSIFYTSFDVCPALKTEILDLNVEACPLHYRSSFDVVLNFGTTEHIIDQVNSFRVMHDALKAGGTAFHQVPTIGWHGHGYFTYQPTFFDDLLRVNGYELLDRWYTRWRESPLDPAIDIRDPRTPDSRDSGQDTAPTAVPNYNLNVICLKKRDQPFRVGLELATSHSALAGEVAERYRDSITVHGRL